MPRFSSIPAFAIAAAATAATGFAIAHATQSEPKASVVEAKPRVGLGGTLALSDTVSVTPLRIIEDSRCPYGVVCEHPGYLIVETRIDGPDWSETEELSDLSPKDINGAIIEITSATPYPEWGKEIAPEDYYFTYKMRPAD